jgi:hypothetical protein
MKKSKICEQTKLLKRVRGIMFIAKIHTLNWFATAMPKLSMTLNNGNTNIDVAALLKKNGILGDTKSSNTDTLEITVIRKETNTPTEAKNDAIELAKYVSRRNKEIRDSIPKPIPPEMGWAIVNADYPHKEEIERQNVLAAKLGPIDAKMKCGKQLAPEEKNFLKEHFPEYYLIAIRIEREMEQFRKQLSRCDTKEDKLRLAMEKKKQLLGVSKIDPGYVQCMLAAIDEEVKNL